MPNGLNTNNSGRQANAEVRRKVQLAAEIFDEYGDDILAKIRFHLNDKSNAEDILHDFFLSLVSKPIPPNIQNIRGYLYRAVTNDIFDAVRRAKSYVTLIRKYAQCRKHSVTHENPQSIALRAEKMQKVFQLIETELPPHEAKAIAHRYIHNRNTSEAAKKMQVNERTFSRYLCTGQKKIRQYLHENQGHPNAFF